MNAARATVAEGTRMFQEAAVADLVLALRAGVEASVAATKSYLATLAALIRLAAAWTQDAALESAVHTLPALMQSTYRLIATLAIRRGFDPDHPAHFRKVTETM
jgi:fructoselysine-6-P-deglycase FrlB-like protein